MTNNGTLNYNLTSEKPAYMLSEENYTKYINERNKFDPTYPDPNDIRFDAPQYSYSVEETSLYRESSSGELTLVGSVYYPKTGNLVKFENNQAIELDEPATGNKVPLNSIKKLIPGIEYEFVPIPDYSREYLTFVALEDGTFQLSRNAVSYSLDNGETWASLAANTASPTVTTGSKIMWKGALTPQAYYGIGTFSSTGNFDVQGNIMSLLYGNNFKNLINLTGKNYAFYQLFYYNTKVVNTKNLSLPATTLATECYRYMFNCCTSLVTTPKLPATTLADRCYEYMFYGCTSLTTVPALSAITLADYCYEYMFLNCTNLTTVPELPATILAQYCYCSMFEGCTNLTTAPELSANTLATSCYLSMFKNCINLTTAPKLPATTLAGSCYSHMFENCINLTTAPELPATKLANSCYYSMFSGCTNVLPDTSNIDFTSEQVVASGGLIGLFYGTKVTDNDLMRILPKNDNGKYCLPVMTLAWGCYSSMFQGCTSLVTAPELPATELSTICYQSMFNGCTSLTTAPELPATTLTQGCYDGMFCGCTNLITAPELPATTLTNSCYNSMFNGCTSLVNAPELPATTLVPYCYKYMFKGCTNLNYIKAMFTTTPNGSSPYYYTQGWVSGVAASGTFVKNSVATWNVTGTNGVPSNWTIQTASE